MQNLKAATRLKAELIEGTDEIEAQFDTDREQELRNVQGHMRRSGLIFSFSQHHLYHKSNLDEIAREAKQAADVLNDLGYRLRIIQGVFERPSFALRGKNGIVLQKVPVALRIFFSV
jgi:hypothetical protein